MAVGYCSIGVVVDGGAGCVVNDNGVIIVVFGSCWCWCGGCWYVIG